MKLNIKKLQSGGNITAEYSLPEVTIYPQNRFGDIARKQGIQTARNWKAVKEGTTAGINNFVNHPVTQGTMALLPLPSGFEGTGEAVKLVGKSIVTPIRNAVGRLANKADRVEAMTNYFSPFGYQLFNSYDGKIPEAYRFFKGYVVKGVKDPKSTNLANRMNKEPLRTSNRLEAFRKYLGSSKEGDNLYLLNEDGKTWRYNPDRIPQQNIDYQREAFIKAGNGNSSQEYLTTDIIPGRTRSGNAGGVRAIIDTEGNFIIDDVFDLHPLQKYNWLPNKLRNLEAGKFIGGKPFHVIDKEIGTIHKKSN